MIFKDITNKTDYVLIILFSLIFISAAFKPFIDYFSLVPHYQVITVLQFFTLVIFITLFNKTFYRKIDYLSFFLLLYILIRFTIGAINDIIEGDIYGIVSSLYVVLRTFLIVYLFQMLSPSQRGVEFYEALKSLIIGYFIVTFIYSIMQYPAIFDISWIRGFGGNSTSGNAFGFFRTNGGIGGTVIDYANFLLAISWLLIFTPFKNKKVQFIFLVILAASVFFCFSRSLFLSLLFIFMVYFFSSKNVFNIAIKFVLINIAILLLLINIDFLIDLYKVWSGDSDIYRLSQWKSLFDGFSLGEYFVGKELGGNTGLFIDGSRYKISGDGFVTGFIYDAGIIGILVIIAVLISKVFSLHCNFKIKVSIIGSLMIMLIVNSGFEKLFIVMTYIISIVIIGGTYRYKAIK